MNEVSKKRFEDLVKMDSFWEKINEAETLEEKQRVLKEEGVEMTIDEIQNAIDEGKKYLIEKEMMSEEGELSPELLEVVSGGVQWGMVFGGIAIAGASAFAGVPVGVVFGAGIIIGGFSTKKRK